MAIIEGSSSDFGAGADADAGDIAIKEYEEQMEDTSDGYSFGGAIEIMLMTELMVRVPCRARPSASSPAMTGPLPSLAGRPCGRV